MKYWISSCRRQVKLNKPLAPKQAVRVKNNKRPWSEFSQSLNATLIWYTRALGLTPFSRAVHRKKAPDAKKKCRKTIKMKEQRKSRRQTRKTRAQNDTSFAVGPFKRINIKIKRTQARRNKICVSRPSNLSHWKMKKFPINKFLTKKSGNLWNRALDWVDRTLSL